ncbi:MAG: hypothetical protein NkDv07_0518 [Candidatus Improbicoccus devescovinae]|nr:MAG: hypothetical protein NkDv07_0518 [Candidatus Improbicoccus devescovinae]
MGNYILLNFKNILKYLNKLLIIVFIVLFLNCNARLISSHSNIPNIKKVLSRAVDLEDAEQEEELDDTVETAETDYVKLCISLTSKSAQNILRLVSSEKLKKFEDIFVENYKILIDLKLEERLLSALADIIFLQTVANNDLFPSEDLSSNSQKTIALALKTINSNELEKYSTDDYDAFINDSEDFGNSGKKTGKCLPENVVFFGKKLTLKNAPVTYDKNVLLSIDDILNLTDGTATYMTQNPTIVLKIPQIGTLEIESGSTVAYVNDKEKSIPPILNINGKIYLPGEATLNLLGLKSISIPTVPALVIYKYLS